MLKTKEPKGITLISLVITIIILLILAAVAINLAIDSNGLFAKAGKAANKWNTSVAEEKGSIQDILDVAEEMSPTLKPMVTKWNIAAGDKIEIRLYSPEDMNDNALIDNTDVTINWGDGTEEHYTSSNLTNGIASHTYTNANSNTTVVITGKCNAIAVNDAKLISIEEWGYTETTIYMFVNCRGLASIASPEKHTFKNVTSFYATFGLCSSLTSIPDNMFANCTNVTSFETTFLGCSSLTSVGDYAFANCTNVTSFEETFYGCSSLTSIGDYAFANRTALENANGMFAECPISSIGAHAFDGCSSVEDFSSLFTDQSGSITKLENLSTIEDYAFSNCTNVTSFNEIFADCSNLTSIGNYAFSNCTNVTSFNEIFADCSNLTSIGNYAFSNCTALENVNNMFKYCPISSIGAHAFDGCSSVEDFSQLFGYSPYAIAKLENQYITLPCIDISIESDYKVEHVSSVRERQINLSTIGDYAFANCTSAKNFAGLFEDCENLESIPEHLFENTPNVASFKNTFAGCTSLTGNALPLWTRVTTDTTTYEGVPDGYNCYYGCTGLTNYDAIPDYWKNAPSQG